MFLFLIIYFFSVLAVLIGGFLLLNRKGNLPEDGMFDNATNLARQEKEADKERKAYDPLY